MSYFKHLRFKKKISKDWKISATEVTLRSKSKFILQYKFKFEEKIPLLNIKRKLLELEEPNPGIKEKFFKKAQNFYEMCLEYFEESFKADIIGSVTTQ